MRSPRLLLVLFCLSCTGLVQAAQVKRVEVRGIDGTGAASLGDGGVFYGLLGQSDVAMGAAFGMRS